MRGGTSAVGMDLWNPNDREYHANVRTLAILAGQVAEGPHGDGDFDGCLPCAETRLLTTYEYVMTEHHKSERVTAQERRTELGVLVLLGVLMFLASGCVGGGEQRQKEPLRPSPIANPSPAMRVSRAVVPVSPRCQRMCTKAKDTAGCHRRCRHATNPAPVMRVD
jgi:hypothetical protein